MSSNIFKKLVTSAFFHAVIDDAIRFVYERSKGDANIEIGEEEASQAIRTFDILKYYNVHRDLMTCVIRDRDMRLNSSERKKILFVDDDSDITTISKAALERNGFEVQTFESPISALENFRPGSYDLLLIDIKMKEMDGFELYDKLRKMDNNINVCFLTAAQEYYDKYKERYSWIQKECFIMKPIALKNLVNTINSILR